MVSKDLKMANANLKTVSTYSKGNFPFPKDEIPESEKNAEWCMKWCQAAYATWITDRTGIPYSQIEELRELRRYGDGNQDIGKYQERLLSEEQEDGELKGYLNVNWEIFSVMPKFKHIIQGIFEEQEHAIVATAVDPKSIEDREVAKLRKWFKGRYKPLLDTLNNMAGARPEPEWIPETVDELELYQDVGGFKFAKETEIEEALKYTDYISDWKETKRKMIDDFVDINCAAVKDFTDPYTRKAKTRYVDPVKLIIQYSRHWDYRNSEYAGELITETISNIRKNTNLSEDELRTLAQVYNGRYSNKNLSSWAEDDLKIDDGWKYDNFLIEVMDCEWFSVNSKSYTRRKTSRGDELYYEEKSKKVYDTDKKKTEIKRYKVVYRAKWIVGTEHVYDWGLQYDVPRPGKKEVELSYKFYKLPGRSIVSVAVPNLDQIQLTWLKLQNALAMASPAGVAIEYSTLMNMTLGGEKMQPLDLLSIRRETGDLIWKATTHQGRPNSNARPIQELQGGIGNQLNEFITLFETNLQFIRELTGINRIADASDPNPEQSVGGAQLAVAATNNALKPIYSGYIRLKEQAARSSALRIQLLVKHDKKAYEGYIPVIGGAGVKIMTVGADAADADFSIMIQAQPTQQRKEVILQSAMKAMQPDRDGNVGIEEADFMMIERLLEAGNLKLAEVMLNHKSRKNKERQLQLQRENMELDSQNQQKAAMVKGEQERQTKQFESQLKIQEETVKADLEDRNNQRQHERDMQLEMIRKSMDQDQNINQQKSA